MIAMKEHAPGWILPGLLLVACGGGGAPDELPQSSQAVRAPATFADAPQELYGVNGAVPRLAQGFGTPPAAVVEQFTDDEGNVYQLGPDKVWRKWEGTAWVPAEPPR